MSEQTDINPVTHITADAIGPAGQRVFYLQAQQETRTITMIAENFQIQSLAIGIEQFLAEINEKFPGLDEASHEYNEKAMEIQPPVDPIYRLGELALGYDVDSDRVILVTKEIQIEGMDEDDVRVIRLWCSRSQMRALAHWGMEIVSRGRPLCPQCGAPMNPDEAHFCPKKNGHRID